MFGMDQQLVVHSLDDNLLGLVLAHIEPQLQEFVVAFVLDKGGAESVQPSPHVALLRVGRGRRRRGGGAVSDGGTAGGFCEEVGFSSHEFGPEASHFFLHLPHLSIKPLSDVAEFGIYDAEIPQLDGDVSLYSTLSHFGYSTS